MRSFARKGQERAGAAAAAAADCWGGACASCGTCKQWLMRAAAAAAACLTTDESSLSRGRRRRRWNKTEITSKLPEKVNQRLHPFSCWGDCAENGLPILKSASQTSYFNKRAMTLLPAARQPSLSTGGVNKHGLNSNLNSTYLNWLPAFQQKVITSPPTCQILQNSLVLKVGNSKWNPPKNHESEQNFLPEHIW